MVKYESDYNELSPIEGSMCVTCKHRISRTILPLNYDDFDIDREEIILEDGTEAPIVHNACMELNMDLDHIVLNCNKYEKDRQSIIGNFFLKNT